MKKFDVLKSRHFKTCSQKDSRSPCHRTRDPWLGRDIWRNLSIRTYTFSYCICQLLHIHTCKEIISSKKNRCNAIAYNEHHNKNVFFFFKSLHFNNIWYGASCEYLITCKHLLSTRNLCCLWTPPVYPREKVACKHCQKLSVAIHVK